METVVEPSIMAEMTTNTGSNLLEQSREKTVFLVFLRHFGCVFCKEALSDLAAMREDMASKGVAFVFVHMSNYGVADQYFKDFELEGVQHISDPEKQYYIEFGLRKGSFSQLYGLSTWMRGFSPDTKKYKLELAQHLGDSTQMPGIFVIQSGEIKDSYIHKLASDRPDYNKLLQCCVTM